MNDSLNSSNIPMDDEEDLEAGWIPIGNTGIKLPPPPPPACTFDNTGPRLIITHIENEFFKSYAGKQVRYYIVQSIQFPI